MFGERSLEVDESVTVEGAIPRREVGYFAARLLSLGSDVHVLSPPELVGALRTMAEAVVARYNEPA
jgi:predicted DNA-binding transcriptional regulator YafY